MTTETKFASFIEAWLHHRMGVPLESTQIIKMVILFVAMILIALVLWFIAQQFINKVVNRVVRKTTTRFDDYLFEYGVFRKLGHIVPIVAISGLSKVVFSDYPAFLPAIKALTGALETLVIMRLAMAFTNAAGKYLSESPTFRDKPIASFTQLTKILIWSIGLIILFSIVFGKNPLKLFTALGALSAVLLLIFKDTLLGFIASIQLTINDMVRIGDWVSVPKYGADGDVVEINLTTVKVRNWDNTISTVPTYSFVSESFTNWRGMQESGGRRIKRSVNIKISTVKFCDEAMLERFKKIELVRDYIISRKEEIDAYNAEHNVDTKASLVNGRRMTNLGVFRRYGMNYLAHNPNVNTDMMYMVRQMQPTEHGVPMEVYCFSKHKTWVEYETVQSDIFDHLLAVVPHFDLEVFEAPAGSDFQKLTAKTN
jgi:miniconductance mechanosensitive channel